MDDKELFEQLTRGPLNRNGFDEALRRKINHNLDQPRRKTNGQLRLFRWSAITATLLIIAAVAVGLWSWRGDQQELTNPAASDTVQIPASAQPTSSKVINPTPHSAVVIGLREDNVGATSNSSYRTIIVAPENNELTFVRSGPGIWMPYKMNFWQIDALTDSSSMGNQTLVAWRDGRRSATEKWLKTRSSQTGTEKLLYAGNRFVSIVQTSSPNKESGSEYRSHSWMNVVTDLALDVRISNANGLADNSYSLSEALGLNQGEYDHIEQWAIARDSGQWIAKQPSVETAASISSDIRDWPAIPVQLTQEIVQDKPLALTWEAVQRLEPAAVDAFTSQDEDIALIVTDSSIEVIPYQLPDAEMKSNKVSVPISRNESVVMVQWATEKNYVENWIKMFSEWFEAPSE